MPDPLDKNQRTEAFIRSVLSHKPDAGVFPLLDPDGRQFARGIGWIGHQTQSGRVLWRLHRDPQGAIRLKHNQAALIDDLIDDTDDLEILEEWEKQEWGEAPSQELVRSQLDETPATIPCLWWDNVRDAMHRMYEYHCGRRWAYRSWGLLRQAGRTAYRSEPERMAVLFRGLALRVIYAEFDQGEWNGNWGSPVDDIDLERWASVLGLTPFRLGWLLGRDGAVLRLASESSTEFELVSATVRLLLLQTVQEVVTSLRQTAGGNEALMRVFLESSGYRADGIPRRKGDLKPMRQQTMEALRTWIENSCPVLL